MLHPAIIDKINRERREREMEDRRLPLYLPIPEPPRRPPERRDEPSYEINYEVELD